MSARASFLGYGSLCVALALGACGRTPEARTAYPCLADLTADCAGLEEQRENLENAYQQEAAKETPDPVRADDIATCSRTVVEQQLVLKCFNDRCAALCELHPCEVEGGATCEDTCAEVAEADEIGDPALEAAILLASERPGFCTCQVCDQTSAALCDEPFLCP